MKPSPYFFSDRRVHFAALVAVILLSAVLRFSLFAGYIGLDDAEYARIAQQIVNGTFSSQEYGGPPVFPLRIGLTAPTALAYRTFGFGEASMVLYPFVLSVLALVLAYVCTAHFFGQRAGLIAACLLGLTPMELGSATKLLPDMPAAFYAALGVTVIALAERSRAESRSGLFWAGCLAGISFGFSWLCKESIAYLAPFCLLYAAISFKANARKSLFLWTGVAVGALGILLGETVTYFSLTGDPLFRFHAIERNYRELENGFFTEGSDFGWTKGESYMRALAKRLLVSGPGILLLDQGTLFLPLAGLIAAFHAWYSKDKSFLIPCIWLISLLLMFNFASTSLSSYMPVALFHRYFYMIIFPSVVLVSGLLGKLVFEGRERALEEVRGERRFWGATLAIAITFVAAYDLQGSLRAPSNWTSELRSLRPIVQPSSRLYADTLSIRGFEFLWGYPRTTQWTDFADLKAFDEVPPGSLVLVNRAYIEWLNRNGGMWLSPRNGYRKHDFYENPPSSWTEVWQNANVRMYRVE